MRISVDDARAEEVLGTLYKLYRVKEFPFNLSDAQPPQVPENMPRLAFHNGREHACFLFLSCLWMRGSVKSEVAFRALSSIFDKSPWLFDPRLVAFMKVQEITDTLGAHSLGFNLSQNSHAWIENMRRIRDSWNSDPRTIFAGVTTYRGLCERVCNRKTKWKMVQRRGNHQGFWGFQKKMVSMLAYFFLDAKLIPPLTFPLPVDFHVLRVFLSHEILRVQGTKEDHYSRRLEDAAREVSLRFAKKHGVDPLDMSTFVWCFSRAMCALHPGNVSTYEGNRLGKRGDYIIHAKPVMWGQAQKATYLATCGQCPVQTTCKYCIPAAPYYKKGMLVLRSRRDGPPQQRLFSPTRIVTREKRDWRRPEAKAKSQDTSNQHKLFS